MFHQLIKVSKRIICNIAHLVIWQIWLLGSRRLPAITRMLPLGTTLVGLQTLRQHQQELCVVLPVRFGLGHWLMRQRCTQFYVRGPQGFRQLFLAIHAHE